MNWTLQSFKLYLAVLRFTFSFIPQTTSKWGDLGSLVNLGSISKNESVVVKQAQQAAASNYTTSSFAGLDGFSKSQTMVSIFSFPRPLLSHSYLFFLLKYFP